MIGISENGNQNRETKLNPIFETELLCHLGICERATKFDLSTSERNHFDLLKHFFSESIYSKNLPINFFERITGFHRYRKLTAHSETLVMNCCPKCSRKLTALGLDYSKYFVAPGKESLLGRGVVFFLEFQGAVTEKNFFRRVFLNIHLDQRFGLTSNRFFAFAARGLIRLVLKIQLMFGHFSGRSRVVAPTVRGKNVGIGWSQVKEFDIPTHFVTSAQTQLSGVIVGFHSTDAFYVECAEHLKHRLDKLGLLHSIEMLPGDGGWLEKTGRKPDFLRSIRGNRSGAILYIDVDTHVHRNPWQYLESYFDCDIAVFREYDGVVRGGTVFINETKGATRFLHAWSEIHSANQHLNDQDTLNIAVDSFEKDPLFKIKFLPKSFLYKLDDNVRLQGGVFVEHLQASRVTKDPLSKKSYLARKVFEKHVDKYRVQISDRRQRITSREGKW
jgi:hypothetical protein